MSQTSLYWLGAVVIMNIIDYRLWNRLDHQSRLLNGLLNILVGMLIIVESVSIMASLWVVYLALGILILLCRLVITISRI